MRVYSILILLFALSACKEVSEQPKTIVVYGDSLCAAGWPNLVQGYEMTNRCFGGRSLTVNYPDTTADKFDYTVIALGVNDAGQNVDPATFELLYRQLYDSVKNPICWVPPITGWAILQPRMEVIREIILDVCDQAIQGVQSDAYDGLHYTAEAQQLNAYNFEQFIATNGAR